MRTAILIFCLLLPQAIYAQFKKFEPGTYILDADRKTRHDAELKLKSSTQLVVRAGGKQNLTLRPKDIYSFRIGLRRYRTASGFEVKMGLGREYVDEGFVELLDSGQVLLMRYDYEIGSPGHMGAGGMMSGGFSYAESVYLLRGANSYSAPVVIKGNGNAKEQELLKSTLAYYVAQRPDLAQLLQDGRIFIGNLQSFVHAINTGQPFN